MVDPGAGAEHGAPQPAEGAEPDLVALVEEGALEALDRVHGSSLTPQPNTCSNRGPWRRPAGAPKTGAPALGGLRQ
ncbi:hypothetical protein GCM10010371_62850 [Streptomyces subrutilus]|uniref:Uncharacterized protein n=1 Tax=Streptomyces subrutilus TaxID=36818 RepID=A0A918VE82_9ACTN|nr:hypothetical protein GCM10010371_62850 [Streptomyces subrutilus]